jgi:tyrosyl-tRNA synthetase
LNVNGVSITTEEEVIKATGARERLLHNKYLILKVGKKSFALVEVEEAGV